METWLTKKAADSLSDAYGFQIRAVVPMRSVVGILTDQGRYVCKRYGPHKGISYRRLLGIVSAKDELAKHGLVRPYLNTTMGQPLFVWDNAPVTVESWVHGRHADLRDRKERIESVQAVARLHKARISVPRELSPESTVLHKLTGRLQRAAEVVSEGKLTGLSKQEWARWLERSTKSLRMLSDPKWESFFYEDKNAGVLCHRDLAPHNILISRGHPASLIDFDLAGMDSPVYDLFQLFDHVVYRALPPRGWDLEMIQAYEKIRPLSRKQKQALMLLRSFPSLLLREIADLQELQNDRARERLGIRIRYVMSLEEERSLAIS